MNGFAFIIIAFIGIFISGGFALRHFLLKQVRAKGLKNGKYIYKTLTNTTVITLRLKSKKRRKASRKK